MPSRGLVPPGRHSLAIVLATDEPAGDCAPPCDCWSVPLCGRPAVEWLLDTVVELEPDAIGFAGRAAGAVRVLAEARPVLGPALSAGQDGLAGWPGLTVTLSCLSPLLQPAGIRRAIAALDDTEFGVAVIRSRGPQCWWSQRSVTCTLVAVVQTGDPAAEMTVIDAGLVESLRVDDPVERHQAESALYQRIAVDWQRRGVLIEDPATTRIDATVRIGRGSRIRPHTELVGSTAVGSGASIGPVTTMIDTIAGDECVVRYAVCEEVTIGDNARIGPYTWLRSGTRLGARTRAGSFVEVSNSVVGDDSQIPHVVGLMNADVGKGCNIAGMSGTATFDGLVKHRVEIGDHVFVGAGTIMVGPMSVGDGAYTAAGSVLSIDVPGGALASSRSRQFVREGWVAANLPGTAAARAKPVPPGSPSTAAGNYRPARG
jgi:serine acetyltransferase